MLSNRGVRIAAAVALAISFSGAANRCLGVDGELPPPLRDVGFDQRLGADVPLDLLFRDESGQEIPLGRYFGEQRPVILSLVYYRCPMLCTLVLNGLTSSLKALPFAAGREFEIVTVSFDPRETPALAAAKKAAYLERYGRPEAGEGWHFLTGDEDPIRRLADAVGFRYTYDPELDQYAHASGILVLTPEGKIARVFYGVEYAPRDLRLGLVEASQNRIGTLVDQLLLFCFHYDPAAGKYGAVALNLVRAGGVVTVLGGGLAIASLLRRERRRASRITAGGGPGTRRA
jgi:protein SCO1/2